MKAFVLALAAVGLVGCASSPSAKVATPNKVTHLVGMVSVVEPLGKRTLQVIPVPVDPHFALFVQIHSASPSSHEFEPGHEVVFGIHSPVQLFLKGAEDVIGKQFEFAFSRPEGYAR